MYTVKDNFIYDIDGITIIATCDSHKRAKQLSAMPDLLEACKDVTNLSDDILTILYNLDGAYEYINNNGHDILKTVIKRLSKAREAIKATEV